MHMEQRRRVYLKTMGCQMNEHDSEVILGILESLGYQEADHPDSADLILYNTCCVRENPERKVYGHMASFRMLKEKNPNLIVGICGCMTQQKQELETIRKRLPHVDLIFGTHNIHRLPQLLERAESGEQIAEVWDQGQEIIEDLPVHRKDSVKAFVNVIYGCTNFCTYCIVPYTRGRERSREPQAIVDEVRNLTHGGIQEVTLLGQNVNAYGRDLDGTTDFAALLEKLNAVEGLQRIRFTTSHPRDMQGPLIEAMGHLDKVCEHLHLPVQSGSTRLLRQMNRGYTKEEYLKLVERIRETVPDISLTTDIIVGFPGETAEDHRETIDLVEKVGFSSAFTFLYSPRTGTPAAAMDDQVPESVKKERIYDLIERQNQVSASILNQEVGKTRNILIEAYDPDRQRLLGRTRQHYQVAVPGPPPLVGRIVPVKINSALTWTLRGTLLDEPCDLTG